MNPHPSIFPRLIELWNESPGEFYRYLLRFRIQRDDADAVFFLIQRWIDATGYPFRLTGTLIAC